MAVLQAYQADLLKGLDEIRGLFPEAVEELHNTMDLDVCAIKQTGAAIGRAEVAVVAMADVRRKENNFLLDAPLVPSRPFSTSIKAVVEKLREARVQSAAFRRYIPHQTRSSTKTSEGAGASRSEDCMATHAPPPQGVKHRGGVMLRVSERTLGK